MPPWWTTQLIIIRFWNYQLGSFQFFNVELLKILYPSFIELRTMEYNKERLEVLGFTTLETRHKRGDLIQIFKIFKGIETVVKGIQLGGTINTTYPGNVSMKNGSLLNRNPINWNLLPPEIVEADTVIIFKACLYRHIELESLRRSVYRVWIKISCVKCCVINYTRINSCATVITTKLNYKTNVYVFNC